MIELVLPSAHRSPQQKGKPIGSATFAEHMAQYHQNGISISSAICARLTSVTDRSTKRPTDRPRHSVGNKISRIYVYSTAMWPNNVAKSNLTNKAIRHKVINLFYSRHTTISDDIIAVMQNTRRIVFFSVVTWLYLQT